MMREVFGNYQNTRYYISSIVLRHSFLQAQKGGEMVGGKSAWVRGKRGGGRVDDGKRGYIKSEYAASSLKITFAILIVDFCYWE